MKRSSSDNPPRVGMVVRFARDVRGLSTPLQAPQLPKFTVLTEQLPAFQSSHALDWNRGQYDIISEPTEMLPYTATSSQAPCNCPQSLAMLDALRRIVSAMDDCNVNAAGTRDPVDVLTEVNLIAREALK